jgi:hypothetical protein
MTSFLKPEDYATAEPILRLAERVP